MPKEIKINYINNCMNNVTIEDKDKNQENSFSDETIKKSLQDYLDLVATKEGRIGRVLVKLGLLGAEEIKDTDDDTEDGYVKTNIKYSDYKNAMLNYVTESIFNDKFLFGFKNKDGFLYYHNGGATGSEYRVDDIRIKGDYSDSRYIGNVVSINVDNSEEKMNVEFGVTNNNGKCVIDYCDI